MQPVTSPPPPSALEQREWENHHFMQGRISQLENQVFLPYCSSHASSLADLGGCVSTLLIQITELGAIFV